MRVIVVGAGIAGLSAAWFLRRRDPGTEVVVLEGSPRIGGKIASADLGGHTVDVGAEAFLARRPEALDLVADLGASGRVAHPAGLKAGVWTRGALRTLPPTVLGIPADADALAASGIVAEPVTSTVLPVPAEDVAIGPYVADRVGPEVRDRLVEPLLGGVYAGRVDALGLHAAAPQIAALGDDLLAGAARQVASATDAGPVFAGLDGGVTGLVELLAGHLDVRTRHTVRLIERASAGWIVSAGPVGGVEEFEADAVVLAVPGPAAARLLADVAPEAAFEVGAIDYASMAIVTYAIPTSGLVAPVTHSGFLVPAVERTYIKAATFSSAKWPWLADRVGPDTTVMRCSVGRMGDSAALLHAPDADVADRAYEDLGRALGLSGPPDAAHVQRWGGALPQYEVGHVARVDRIEGAVAGVPGLAVCGAAYRGVGIPAVIASAERAVATVHR